MKHLTHPKNSIFFILFFTLLNTSNAQQAKGWTAKNIFEKRFFIENLGQFDEHKQKPESKINYGSYTKGTHIYFSNSGFIFNHYVRVSKSKKEIRAHEKWMRAIQKDKGFEAKKDNDGEELSKGHTKYIPVYQELIWEGANQNPIVTVSEKLVTYHCYQHPITKKSIKADAYAKMTYHDVYPNIDVEFYFPEDSSGFKYNYVVREGGNPNLIKEHWVGQPKINMQVNGDVLVESKFGNLLSRKPVSYSLLNNNKIETNYLVTNNTISYSFKGNTGTSFIIDPWVSTPAFPSGTSANDVDFDVAGNCFVYGGLAPYAVIKFNNVGTALWTYTASSFTSSYYGDFGVDQNTGTSYLVNGYSNPGEPNAIKISSAGTFVADHFGSSDMNEAWRMAFSSCTNQAVIGGGGTSGTDQIAYLDTNLVSISTVNVLSTSLSYLDISLLTVDNYGSCYFLHANNTVYFSGYENAIVKSPMPTFLPLTYSSPTTYSFQEVASSVYMNGNGYNGLAIGDKSLYSYDAYVLEKRNATTGTLLITKPINSPPTSAVYKEWGGLGVDNCQNLFMGSRDTVFQYDSLLNQVNFYPMTGTVLDVRVSGAGVVYAAGGGFVTAFIPTSMSNCGSPINPNLNVVNSTCYTQGSASVSPTGGSAPYTITWSTIPVSTGTSVTDLAPGTYTVTITDASCNGNFGTTSFTITAGPGGFSTGTIIQNISCNGLSDGSISLNPSGGISPYTYTWDTLGLTGSSATGLGAGVYEVLVTDSAGCLNDLTLVITEPTPLTGFTNADTLDCFGDNGSIVCFPSGGTAPYSVVWNTPLPVLNDTIPVATAGIYSITITDSMGCTYNFTDTLYEPAALNLTLTTQNVSCDGTVPGMITANVTGGTGTYTYSWSNDVTNNTNVDPDLLAGIYSLTVTDANGCTISASDTVLSLVFPTISFTSTQPCNGGTNGTITAIPLGGSPGTTFNYSWNTSPVQTGLIANNVPTGSYILSVEAAGCTFTFPVILGEDAIIDTMKIDGVICGGSDMITLNLPSIAQPSYTWFNTGVVIPSQTSSTYLVPVVDVPFISATWYSGGCKYLTTTIETAEYPVAKTSDIPNIFSPNADGLNNTYYAFKFIATEDPATVTYLFEEFSLQIFNRWGQMIFESTDPLKGWNGQDSGNGDVPEGVYFILIKFKALCAEKEEEIIYNGTVQLVR